MNTYISTLFNLEGRTAVVTGAGGYLCSEMAKSFARAGCKVAVLDLRLEKAKAVEDEIRAEGFSDVLSLEIDVAKKWSFYTTHTSKMVVDVDSEKNLSSKLLGDLTVMTQEEKARRQRTSSKDMNKSYT